MCRKPTAGFTALIIFLSVIVAKSLLPQQALQYLALITDIKKEVMVKRAQRGDFEKALWGMQLYQGDRIKTLEGSEVSILFSNNNLITLGPNSSLTISEGRVSPEESPKPIRNVNTGLLAELSSLTLRQTSKGEIGALAGLRYGGAEHEIELISPRNSKIKTTRPSFNWKCKREFDKFIVKLYDSNGLIWQRTLSETEMVYPEDENPLEYGQSYFWHVEGEGLLESFKSKSIGFTVLSREELQRVQTQENKVKDMFKDDLNSSNFHFILGAYYDNKGLLQDAIAKFEMIADLNADAPFPHEILGRLYSNIGLKDQAIAELQMAIKLSQRK